MFEHSLYEPERVASPLQEGDLFYDYEIRNWELTPRIYRILAISAAANILAILIVGQTSLLTMKGCDSPLVGRVCQVLDTVYVGSMLFGTDRDYVDAVYEKTELGDSEITFVDVSGETPPLSYPEGYFQIANPEEFALSQQMAMDPGFNSGFPSYSPNVTTIPPTSGNSLLNTQPVMPTPNPSVVQGDLPTFGGNDRVAGNPPTNRRRGNRPVVTEKIPDEDDSAQVEPRPSATPGPDPSPTPLKSEEVTALPINKRPLIDFADKVGAQWETKELDLNQPFVLKMDAALSSDGRLDPSKVKFHDDKMQGDVKMLKVAKDAILAVGDSGFLSYLTSLNVNKITVTLSQDEDNIVAIVESSQPNSNQAKTVASGLNTYIAIGKNSLKKDSDELILLNGAQVTAEGNKFILNFMIPKAIGQDMINRKLQEAQANKRQQRQPSGDLDKKSDVRTARR